MSDNAPRRTGFIVLCVVSALLIAGVGGLGALFLAERAAADRARVEQQAELADAKDDLAEAKDTLSDAVVERERARVRYELEADRAQFDRDCIAYIKDILNQMKSRNSISVDYAKCEG
jgi:uncharacterized protein (DUF3084 family)